MENKQKKKQRTFLIFLNELSRLRQIRAVCTINGTQSKFEQIRKYTH